jgi:hypothetical protein
MQGEMGVDMGNEKIIYNKGRKRYLVKGVAGYFEPEMSISLPCDIAEILTKRYPHDLIDMTKMVKPSDFKKELKEKTDKIAELLKQISDLEAKISVLLAEKKPDTSAVDPAQAVQNESPAPKPATKKEKKEKAHDK